MYSIWSHTSIHDGAAPASDSSLQNSRPSTQGRESRRNGPIAGPIQRNASSYVWMTVPKNYRYVEPLVHFVFANALSRECQDDGVLTGILLGPIIASALLHSSLQQRHITSPQVNSFWRIEAPAILPNSQPPLAALDALILSRRNLVDLATFCSTLLLSQVIASWIHEWRYSTKNAPDGERASVPRREGRKVGLYVLFTFGTTLGALCLKFLAQDAALGIWQSASLTFSCLRTC